MSPLPSARIRPAVPGDAESLATLKSATFRETFVEAGGFAIPYPPADLAAFERDSFGVAKVAGELDDSQRKTWVAESEVGLLGYATVGACKLPHPQAGPDAGEIYQLYVRREAQGLGLGRRLLDTALDHLAGTRPGPVWLGVWSGNLSAQVIYAARGFRQVGSYRFAVGRWSDDEFIYRLDRERP